MRCPTCGLTYEECWRCGEWLCECNTDDHECDDEPHHSRGAMHDASDEALERWARAYDDLNGAPESEEDR